MLKSTQTLLLALLAATTLHSQLPKSNVYLFDLQQVSEGEFSLENPKYLTLFNGGGYNNQPAFVKDQELWITSQGPFDGQSDLYALNLADSTKQRITYTPEGEFSAALMPDMQNFSAVRQEFIGGDTIQRLWQFPLDLQSEGRPVLRQLQNIGYYHWLSNREVALFLVGTESTLAIADTYTEAVTELAKNVGRCFAKMPNGNLAYIQKVVGGTGVIMEKNLFDRRAPATPIIDMLPGTEDFLVLPNGTFLAGRGSKLFQYNRFTDEEWKEAADLRFYSIQNISRMAISNSYKLAIVAD